MCCSMILTVLVILLSFCNTRYSSLRFGSPGNDAERHKEFTLDRMYLLYLSYNA